jgi:hypothetical protein
MTNTLSCSSVKHRSNGKRIYDRIGPQRELPHDRQPESLKVFVDLFLSEVEDDGYEENLIMWITENACIPAELLMKIMDFLKAIGTESCCLP